MKKTLFAVLVCTLMTLTLTGCGSKVETDNRVGNVSIEELNDINNKIIYYFNNNGASIYNNYSYNYVDEKDMVVVVGLVNNSKEEQEWFKNNIVDSKYIRFEQFAGARLSTKSGFATTGSTLDKSNVYSLT